MDLLMDVNNAEVPLAVTATSGRVALSGSGKRLIIKNKDLIYGVYVRSGSSTVTATTSHTWIGPGKDFSYGIDESHTDLAAICDSGGTANIRVQRGNGN